MNMKLFSRFIRYLNPSVESKVLKDMDRRTLRNIHIISSVVLLLESVLFFYIAFIILSDLQGFDRGEITSLVSVGYCVVLCAVASFLSDRMLSAAELSHRRFIAFKVFFFILFSLWAIFVSCVYLAISGTHTVPLPLKINNRVLIIHHSLSLIVTSC